MLLIITYTYISVPDENTDKYKSVIFIMVCQYAEKSIKILTYTKPKFKKTKQNRKGHNLRWLRTPLDMSSQYGLFDIMIDKCFYLPF